MAKSGRRFLAPEVVQTSAMDCGPASLKCLLAGFGIHAHYGRLREACQTNVDGTSIDTMEVAAVALGLQAEQKLIPRDHLLLPGKEHLPALVVIRLPNGFTHFIVVWRRLGNWVQIMDPGSGRRWLRVAELEKKIFIHRYPLSGEDWREWAGSDDFIDPLKRRMTLLGCSPAWGDSVLARILEDDSWFSLASLDAAVRLTRSLVHASALKRGSGLERFMDRLLERALQEKPGEMNTLPEAFWCLVPGTVKEREDQLFYRGAVLIHVEGKTQPSQEKDGDQPPSSPELILALETDDDHDFRQIFQDLKRDGLFAPLFLIAAVALASFARLVELGLFRVFLELGEALGQPLQRLGAVGYAIAFSLLILLLELPIANILLTLGRHLETSLRLAFLRKLPRIGDRYFGSRPISDMADRAHRVYLLRRMTTLGGGLLRLIFQMLLTGAGILWIDPALWPYILSLIVVALGLPLVAQPLLSEQNARALAHGGALSRFYLESFLGLVPIRAHRAEDAVRCEQEKLLVEWVKASRDFLVSSTRVNGLVAFFGIGLTLALTFSHLARHGESGLVLLLIYWALKLPETGVAAARLILMYPNQRNTAKRLLEPLGAPEEVSSSSRPMPPEDPQKGVAIQMKGISLVVGGHSILSDIELDINPGEHLAVIGRSGAGKSSLAGLLLGWYSPASGKLLVDGNELDGETVIRLREQTALVDPEVHLWNESLLHNLTYGAPDENRVQLDHVLEQADLLDLLESLPDGLSTRLGEGGALVSGGEGQRVRLGRAFQRKDARLVILDEPFRGLDRAKRAALMARARLFWSEATLIFITHDLPLTAQFERVLVVEDGQLREDGQPADLLTRPESRYASLYNHDREVWERYWSADSWRRLQLARGVLTESTRGGTS